MFAVPSHTLKRHPVLSLVFVVHWSLELGVTVTLQGGTWADRSVGSEWSVRSVWAQMDGAKLYLCIISTNKYTHTHTHTHIYIYKYIYKYIYIYI